MLNTQGSKNAKYAVLLGTYKRLSLNVKCRV
jgi:hypothetical protein